MIMVFRLELMTVMCLALAMPAHAVVEITLKPEVKVGARHYFVRDLGVVEASDAQQGESVSNLEIGEAVRLGVDEVVTRSRIAKVLEAHLPEIRGQLIWHGEDAVRIKWLGVTVKGGDILAVAREQLVRTLAGKSADARIEPVARPQETLVPSAGATSLQARLAPGARLSRRMCVWVDLVNDGQVFRSVPVWFAVSAPVQAWVARSPSVPGAALDAGEFREQQVDLANLQSPPIALPIVSDGWRLKKALSPGAALTADSIETTPPVAKSQTVLVRSHVGAVILETTAVALQDGKIGHLVRLVNSASHQEFVGRVVAPGTALVE